MALCTAEGCAERARAKGLCGKHYQQMRTSGSKSVRSDASGLVARVDEETEVEGASAPPVPGPLALLRQIYPNGLRPEQYATFLAVAKDIEGQAQ